MIRILEFIYGIVAYLIGMGGLFYFILYVGGWDFLPMHIDNAVGNGNMAVAIVINLVLITLFSLQHSIMARPAFKENFMQYFPADVERSTFVLVSGIMMLIICLCWQPIDGALWQFNNDIVKMLFTGIYILGWTIAVISTFLINHFELFGLQQVYSRLLNKPFIKPQFLERLFYKHVRHPLQLGILIGIWATANMTWTHFMLASAFTVYIFIGLYFEEKDLISMHGEAYLEYKSRVPKVFPTNIKRLISK